jgi:hypothetical protein
MALAQFRLIQRLADLKTNGLRKLAKAFSGVARPSNRFGPTNALYISFDINTGSASWTGI